MLRKNRNPIGTVFANAYIIYGRRGNSPGGLILKSNSTALNCHYCSQIRYYVPSRTAVEYKIISLNISVKLSVGEHGYFVHTRVGMVFYNRVKMLYLKIHAL